MRSDMQVVEEGTEHSIFFRKYAGETGQLRVDFGEQDEHRFAGGTGKPFLPNCDALAVDMVLQIVVCQNPAIGGAPALRM